MRASGRSLDQQLAEHYAAAGTPQGTSLRELMRAQDEKASAPMDEIATRELATTGHLSLTTQLYRARDNKQQQAQLLEAIPTNAKLRDIAREYEATYHAAMMP